MESRWIKCNHKYKLSTGEYLLRLEYNGFTTNRQFTVNEKQKELEIPYFNAVAYFKIPEYSISGVPNGEMLPPGSGPIYTHSKEYIEQYKQWLNSKGGENDLS